MQVEQWNRRALVVDAGLGVVFIALLVVSATAIGSSWGGGYWLFDAAAGLVVCTIALVRRLHRLGAAAAGLGVAAVAVVVTRVAELPQEPGPAMALALAVLVGSAVRVLPTRSAVAVAAAGFVVAAGAWGADLVSSSGGSGVAMLTALGWLGAVVAGSAARLSRVSGRTPAGSDTEGTS